MNSYEQFQKAIQHKKRNANFAESNKNRLKKLATNLNTLDNLSNGLSAYKQNTNAQTKKTHS